MSDLILTKTRIHAGRWEAVLKTQATAAPPALEVWLAGQSLPGLEVAPIEGRPGRWRLALAIPPEALSEGVQTFTLRAAGQPAALGHFTVILGQPMEDDIRAELDLLRAELDLLKSALRRHLAGEA